MSIIQQRAEPTERAQQILTLSKLAFEGAQEVKARTRKSVEQATECGRLLIEEQASVAKEMGGKGYWESYYEATFLKTIPRSTAQLWMKLARNAVQLDKRQDKQKLSQPTDAPTPEASEPAPNPNQLRKGMLALSLFPAKIHEPTVDAGTAIATPKLSTHLSLINRFTAWHAQFMSENNGTLTQQQRQQLRLDFAPLITLIDELTA